MENGNHQYLSFTLDDEIFALEIDKVREVLDFTTATKVPQTPDFMSGVINLRGSVVPVIDLRIKFGMEQAGRETKTCIIISELCIDNEPTIIGALADSVQEVLEIYPDQIEPPPKIGMSLNEDFIKGIGKCDEKFILLLNIDAMFSAEEILRVQEQSQPVREAS